MDLARMRSLPLLLFLAVLSSCDEAKFSKSGERSDPSRVSVVDLVNGQDLGTPAEDPPADPPILSEHACGLASDEKKVWVCHHPPGNSSNRHSVCVSVNALPAHLGRHGSEGSFDYVGPCEFDESPTEDVTPGEDPDEDGRNHDHEGHCLPRP